MAQRSRRPALGWRRKFGLFRRKSAQDDAVQAGTGDTTLELGDPGEAKESSIPEPGAFIRGTYRILDRLGSGAMGTVLRALDEQLDREVAIKLVRRELADSSDSAHLFREEARAMARVRHPNVVEIYAFGEHRRRPFFVMQYVPGPNLDQWTREHAPLSTATAIDIIDQICAGVAAIHDAGAVHHDLKPSNILVGPGLRISVADLGLASPVHTPRFGAGEIAGTPRYMAPEIARGEVLSPSLLPRVDVYALAVVAFELLAGDVPFNAKGAAGLLSLHAFQAPPRPSEIRRDLPIAYDAPLLRALAKLPEERTASVEVLRRELLEAHRRSVVDETPPHILLVDDDLSNLNAMVALLSDEFPGARIDSCTDAESALAAVARIRPDVVITDLHMPGGGGDVITRRLRGGGTGREIPIIVVTGQGGATDWHTLRSIGADRFLVKPVDADALINAIRSLVAPR
jgi:serine/threonine protein kinase